MSSQPDLAITAERFLSAFETVFGSDWSYTQSQLGVDPRRAAVESAELLALFGESPEQVGDSESTFLNPAVKDLEAQNWGNYELLLKAYAALKDQLSSSVEPTPGLRGSDMRFFDDLTEELTACEGSFMLQLRCGTWHQGAFRRLTRAAREYLEGRAPESPIPRWIAEGFWQLDLMTQDWVKGWPPDTLRGKYRAGAETIQLLTIWLFSGSNPGGLDRDDSG